MSELVISHIYRKHQDVATNLDCIDEDQLEEITKHPATHPDVKRYAEMRIEAMKCRLSGEIDKATKMETRMECQYNFIPNRLKW